MHRSHSPPRFKSRHVLVHNPYLLRKVFYLVVYVGLLLFVLDVIPDIDVVVLCIIGFRKEKGIVSLVLVLSFSSIGNKSSIP